MQDQIDYLSDFAVYLRTEERSEGTIREIFARCAQIFLLVGR